MTLATPAQDLKASRKRNATGGKRAPIHNEREREKVKMKAPTACLLADTSQVGHLAPTRNSQGMQCRQHRLNESIHVP